jgi:Tfp pilus assembly protein FimT
MQHQLVSVMSVRTRPGGATNAEVRTPPVRRAFTILELVLALAVIAALIGLAWPVMIRFAGEQAIMEGVETVRSRLARTRLLAIGSGLTHQFRYAPNKRLCLVLPAERPLGSGTANTNRTSGQAASAPAAATSTAQVLELSEGLRFLAAPPGPAALMQAPIEEHLPDDLLQMFGAPGSLAQVGWSKPILFSPDGTAEDASLVIADEHGRYQVLSVRGLTGSVYVGPLERERRP